MADLSKMTDWDKLKDMLQQTAEEGKEKKIDPKALLEHMRSRVKGQDHILQDVAKLIHLQMAKTKSNKPIASLLLLGPTGTGKTELAKAITEFLFEDETAMIRFDCADLFAPESKARLIGMPTGYIGYESGGQLTRPMFSKARRLILFDEIEKAHPSVFDLFLQLLGEGRLDEQGSGKTADFTQSVIVLTSNSQVDEIGKIQNEAKDYYEMVNGVKSHLAEAKVFRPEILGRIDRVYVFKPLEGMVVAEIVLMKIVALAKEYGLTVEYVAPQLIMQSLVSNAKVSRFGMRELQRVIENMFSEQMVAARAKRAKAVNLAVNSSGELEVTPVPTT